MGAGAAIKAKQAGAGRGALRAWALLASHRSRRHLRRRTGSVSPHGGARPRTAAPSAGVLPKFHFTDEDRHYFVALYRFRKHVHLSYSLNVHHRLRRY